MNIFFLFRNTWLAARAHSDAHLNKMLVELTQLLSNACHLRGGAAQPPPYRLTHEHHPHTLWVSRERRHFDHACAMAMALAREYRRRRGRVHACTPKVRTMLLHPPCFAATARPYAPTTVLGSWCDVTVPLAMPRPTALAAADAPAAYRRLCSEKMVCLRRCRAWCGSKRYGALLAALLYLYRRRPVSSPGGDREVQDRPLKRARP